MNKRDLRVGNLVEILTSNKQINLPTGQFGIIEEIREEKVKIRLRNESSDVVYVFNRKYDTIRPILITEELLLKFGLKPNQWFCSNSYCVVEDKTGDIHYGWCMKTQNSLHTKEIEFGYFKYVHQLQNLYFALTFDELKLIENEKI